jgi:hypothetical protein
MLARSRVLCLFVSFQWSAGPGRGKRSGRCDDEGSKHQRIFLLLIHLIRWPLSRRGEGREVPYLNACWFMIPNSEFRIPGFWRVIRILPLPSRRNCTSVICNGEEEVPSWLAPGPPRTLLSCIPQTIIDKRSINETYSHRSFIPSMIGIT